MKEPSDRWLALLNQLAEKGEVDWDTQPIDGDEDAELLAQLKSIDDIQKVFAVKHPHDSSHLPADSQALFHWGQLQVLAPLGEGGYGEVFQAYDPVLNRKVALKLLKPDQLAAFHSKLFIEEAQRMAQVRNRHVLAIHGAAVYDGRAGFWADLIIGETLENQHHVDQAALLKVAGDMAHALQAVHQAGLVHGDVKAANVMLDQNHQHVLMDFGAGLTSGSAHPSNHSVGSPLLMAPELFKEQPKSAATDMYALGCLLFKLASDQYPVQGNNVLDIVAAHQRQDYAQLAGMRSDLPRSLTSTIQQLIDPDPARRLSAAQLAEQVVAITKEPRRKKVKRLVYGIIGALLTGLVLATTGLYFADQAREQAVLEQQKAQAVNDFLQEILGASFRLGTGREVRVADVLDLAANNMLVDFKDQPEVLADLSKVLGQSYQNLQVMDKSKQHLLKSLELKQRLLGEAHPETLHVMLLLAKTEETLGYFDQAASYCHRIIALAGESEELQEYSLDAQIILATVYSELNELKRADELLTAVINQAKQSGEASNLLFLALMAHSQNHLDQSDFQAAVVTAQEAIDTILKVENHKATNLLTAKNQLAIALSSQGKYVDAEVILREVMALARDYYGENNLGFLRVVANLGANLQSQGKLEQAVSYQEQVNELSKTLLGPRDRNTLRNQMNLANTYVSLNRLEEGELLLRRLLKDIEEVFGAEQVLTFTVNYNLGELLNNTGRFAESLELSSAVLPLMKKALGENHLVTLLTQDNKAISLVGLEQHTEALDIYEQILPAMEAHFGLTNPYYLLVKSHQVDAMLAAGQQQHAIRALEQLLALQIETLGEAHPDTLKSKERLNSLR